MSVSNEFSISGRLSDKDLKRLTNATRDATVGPTTVYYAGVTAPIISASITLVARTALEQAGFSGDWVFFLSATVAVFAGISWYLIFMRWSYRHRNGRGGEGSQETRVIVKPDYLAVRRGAVETRIGWAAISALKLKGLDLVIISEGAGSLLIPGHWFSDDGPTRVELYEAIGKYAETPMPQLKE